nr:hypothetical protein CFP56_79341 [Quercus suber]
MNDTLVSVLHAGVASCTYAGRGMSHTTCRLYLERAESVGSLAHRVGGMITDQVRFRQYLLGARIVVHCEAIITPNMHGFVFHDGCKLDRYSTLRWSSQRDGCQKVLRIQKFLCFSYDSTLRCLSQSTAPSAEEDAGSTI